LPMFAAGIAQCHRPNTETYRHVLAIEFDGSVRL